MVYNYSAYLKIVKLIQMPQYAQILPQANLQENYEGRQWF